MEPKLFTVNPALVAEQVNLKLEKLRRFFGTEVNRIERIFGSIGELVPYYITPYAQNINPADLPEDNTGLISKNNCFQLLDAFVASPPRFSHAFILSDAGMGKTSLLVMIQLASMGGLIVEEFDLKMYKIDSDTLEQIEAVESPSRTILLLDALDEDPEAWRQFYTRLQEILSATKNFKKVIITCRTQFFPSQYEEDGKIPGLITLHGFPCSKLFLSPFDDDQVSQYIHRRFSDPVTRDKAAEIVKKMRSLKFRPMLLSYIDFLIDQDTQYKSIYDLYHTMVDEWLNRELRKGVISSKRPLLEACTIIAKKLYKNKEIIIDHPDILEMCSNIKGIADFQDMSVEGRSLLHRTSEGGYKFAHYSIMEYFIARALMTDPQPIRNTDQVKSFIVDNILFHKFKRLENLDISQMIITNSKIGGLKAKHSNVDRATFENCDLSNSVFSDTSLKGTKFINCKLHNIDLRGASIEGASFVNAELNGAKLSQLDFSTVRSYNVILSKATLSGTKFNQAILEQCTWHDPQKLYQF